MAEKGILFNGEMMRAIRAGSKSQTRRPMKPQPIDSLPPDAEDAAYQWGRYTFDSMNQAVDYAPYAVGDLLYCRETWRLIAWLEGDGIGIQYRADGGKVYDLGGDDYDDQYERLLLQSCDDCKKAGIELDGNEVYTWPKGTEAPTRWRPSIHMPKWAAREWLKVTAVRAERVQDITPADIIKEGVNLYKAGSIPQCMNTQERMLREMYTNLWESVYPGSWERNDWVWVTEFERTEHN